MSTFPIIEFPPNLKKALSEEIYIPRKPTLPVMPKTEMKFSDLGEYGAIGCFLFVWIGLLAMSGFVNAEFALFALVAQGILIAFLFLIKPPFEMKHKKWEMEEYERKMKKYEEESKIWDKISANPERYKVEEKEKK